MKMMCFFLRNLDKNNESFRFLELADKKGKSSWEIYFKYLVCGILIYSIIAPIISVILCHINQGHFDADFVFYPYTFA